MFIVYFMLHFFLPFILFYLQNKVLGHGASVMRGIILGNGMFTCRLLEEQPL